MMGKKEFRLKFIRLFFAYGLVSSICWGGILYGKSIGNRDIFLYSIYLFAAISFLICLKTNIFLKRVRDIFPYKINQRFKRIGWHIICVSPIFSIYYLYELFTREGYTESNKVMPANNYGRNYLVGVSLCFLFSIVSTNTINHYFQETNDNLIRDSFVSLLSPSGRYLADVTISAFQYIKIKETPCNGVEFCKIKKSQDFTKSKSMTSVDSVLITVISAHEIFEYNKKRKPASNASPLEKEIREIKITKKILRSIQFAHKNIPPETYVFKSWLNGTFAVSAGIEFPLLVLLETYIYNDIHAKYVKSATKLLKQVIEKENKSNSQELIEFKKDAKRMLASLKQEKTISIF